MASSTFYGFQIARTGLHAAKMGMELTGHNIANASTEGYTRQVLHLSSIEGKVTQEIITPGKINHVGGGVSIDYIDQIRNEFLDLQYRSQNSELGDWSVKSEAFYYAENVFKEPSDTGIASVVKNFYSSLSSLSTDASSEEMRTLVRQNAITMTETFNFFADQISSLQDDQDDAIESTSAEINNLIKEIADYNTQIVKYERTGEQANDLNDKRNLCLDRLSELVDISYKYNMKNEVSVYIGVNNLCVVDADDGNAYYTLSTEESLPDYYGREDTFNKLSLVDADGNVVEDDLTGADFNGGTLKGYFDLRDGNTQDNIGLPYFLAKLDELARGIVQAFNDVHSQGYTIPADDNGNVSQNGINLFDDAGGNIDDVTALNMKISDEIMESVWNIAASSVQVDLSLPNTQEGNNENSLAMEGLYSSTTLTGIKNINNFLAGIVSELGVRAQQCNDMNKSQAIIVENVDALRSSVSDVDLDEEVTNLLTYQRAYQASARVMTAIDQMLDKLINGTGSVGL